MDTSHHEVIGKTHIHTQGLQESSDLGNQPTADPAAQSRKRGNMYACRSLSVTILE